MRNFPRAKVAKVPGKRPSRGGGNVSIFGGFRERGMKIGPESGVARSNRRVVSYQETRPFTRENPAARRRREPKNRGRRRRPTDCPSTVTSPEEGRSRQPMRFSAAVFSAAQRPRQRGEGPPGNGEADVLRRGHLRFAHAVGFGNVRQGGDVHWAASSFHGRRFGSGGGFLAVGATPTGSGGPFRPNHGRVRQSIFA